MQETSTIISYKDKEYRLEFNINVLGELQEKYGSVQEWVNTVNLYNKDGEEINVKALIYGLTVAINEGIEISNEEKNEKQKPLTQKQVGRMLTQVGLETASQKVANAVIESTKTDEKNE